MVFFMSNNVKWWRFLPQYVKFFINVFKNERLKIQKQQEFRRFYNDFY